MAANRRYFIDRRSVSNEIGSNKKDIFKSGSM